MGRKTRASNASIEPTRAKDEPLTYSDRSKLVVPLDGRTSDWLDARPYRAALKPWTFPSKGKTSRYPCGKSERPLTLFSDLELDSARWHERRPEVIEMMDQVPLLPVAETRWLAARLGMRGYPAKGRFATTDLVLRIRQESRTWWEAVAVKPMDELKKLRTRSKLEVERLFWHQHGVSWRLDTDESYAAEALGNMRFLAPSRHHAHFMPLDTALGDDILMAVDSALLGPPLMRLCDALAPVDRTHAVKAGTAMSALRWALAVGRYPVPRNRRISPTMCLEDLTGDVG